MIIVNTNLKIKTGIGKNSYVCPHCSDVISFGTYIVTQCTKCRKNIFNIEKLLETDMNANKINYYINESI